MKTTTLYVLAGPITFRRGSRRLFPEKNKKNVGWGGNLQNLEHSLQEVFHPTGFSPSLKEKCIYWLDKQDASVFTEEELFKLRVFCNTDQSGAEALIVAYDAELADYRKLFIYGVKPHVYVAMKLFEDVWHQEAVSHGVNIPGDIIAILCKTPIEDLKKNPYWKELDRLIKSSDNWPTSKRYYYFGKQTCHSANYGIGENTFIMNVLEKSGGKVVLTRDQGKFFLNTYRTLFPEIPDRCARVERQVRYTGILYNMFGHPFIITDKQYSNMKNYYAWGPQSTVGEITRTAVCDMQDHIESNNLRWDFLNDKHDSFMHQCPITEVIDCAKKQQEFINQEFTSPIDGVKFRMRSETKIGFNWGEQSEHNLLGLRTLEIK